MLQAFPYGHPGVLLTALQLHGLKMDLEGHDYESSEDESPLENTPSTQELDRTPSERHAFLFGHNIGISAPNSRDFHPFPSQVPFLFECYSSNVNFFVQIVHMPTVTKMMRGVRGGDMSSLTPANEALLFAIYYAAVTSMEDDDVSLVVSQHVSETGFTPVLNSSFTGNEQLWHHQGGTESQVQAWSRVRSCQG